MPLAEHQYLELLTRILETGDKRVDRTGVGTLSVFGAMVRFDLSNGQVPILTTKRVYWKTAVKEMLWFLTGGTNIQPLLRENVRIWTDWPLAKYREQTGDLLDQHTFEQRVLNDDEFAAKWGELGREPDEPPHPLSRLERCRDFRDGTASVPHGLSISRDD
jgi:thymidylate synthase